MQYLKKLLYGAAKRTTEPPYESFFVVDFIYGGRGEIKVLELGVFPGGSGTAGYDKIHPGRGAAYRLLTEYLRNSKVTCGCNCFIRIGRGAAASPNINYPCPGNLDEKNIFFSIYPISDDYCAELKCISKFVTSFGMGEDALKRLLTVCASVNFRMKTAIGMDYNRGKGKTLDFYKITRGIRFGQDPRSLLTFLTPSEKLEEACMLKDRFHACAKESEIYPKTLLGYFYSGFPRLTQIEQFLGATKSNYYILKPHDRANGDGVVFLKKEDVVKYLQDIAKGKTTDDFWRKNNRGKFLLQVFCPAQPIEIIVPEDENERTYMPTGRVFVACGGGKLKIMDGYWKIAAEQCPKDENDLSAKNTISRVSSRKKTKADTILSCAKMGAEIRDDVFKVFCEHLSAIVRQIDKGNNYDVTNTGETLQTTDISAIKESAREIIRIFREEMNGFTNCENMQKKTLIACLCGLPGKIVGQARRGELDYSKLEEYIIAYWSGKELDNIEIDNTMSTEDIRYQIEPSENQPFLKYVKDSYLCYFIRMHHEHLKIDAMRFYSKDIEVKREYELDLFNAGAYWAFSSHLSCIYCYIASLQIPIKYLINTQRDYDSEIFDYLLLTEFLETLNKMLAQKLNIDYSMLVLEYNEKIKLFSFESFCELPSAYRSIMYRMVLIDFIITICYMVDIENNNCNNKIDNNVLYQAPIKHGYFVLKVVSGKNNELDLTSGEEEFVNNYLRKK